MIILFNFLLLPVCVALLAASGYLLLLTLLPSKRGSAGAGAQYCFDIIVPAHNEEQIITRTITSLLALQWPKQQFRVCVVADNCTDATAERAAAAGAEVWVRNDTTLRGKGYALTLGFGRSAKAQWAHAVVVVDADSEVTPNLLAAFAERMADGAQAMQANYGVLNPHDSWRTQLMTIALTLFNRLRPRGRQAIGGSAGLRGNGMCFTHHAIAQVPHRAFSLLEDLEYGIHLAQANISIWFVDEAMALGEMVSGEAASRSQRSRWEGGRIHIARTYIVPMLKQAFIQRSWMALETAIDLMIPPLAYYALAVLAVWLVSATGLLLGQPLAFGLASAALLLLLGHVLMGLVRSGLGWKGAKALLLAPVYLIWKVLRARPAEASGEWIRTTREKGK